MVSRKAAPTAASFQIRARFDERTVRVYQAYRAEIAEAALSAGRFVPPFSMTRMTWIKPSFNWMMYRSGYGTKAGQEFVLAIDITRDGFEWALHHAVLSAFDPRVHVSHETWRRDVEERPVRVQWDPERDWRIEESSTARAIQVGLTGEAVRRYVEDWAVAIMDVTPLAHRMRDAAAAGMAPPERPDEDERAYPMPMDAAARLVPVRD